MAELLRMPAVAANADRAVLLAWSVGENATFAAADVLAEVETEKAVVDIEAEADGVLLKALVEAGAEVEVGAPIALLGGRDEGIDDISALLKDLGVDTAAAGDNETAAAAPTAQAGTQRRAAPEDPAGKAEATVGETLDPEIDVAGGESAAAVAGDAAAGRPAESSADAPSVARNNNGRVFASPLARRMAADAGLELREIAGSGPDGRVRRDDVRAAIEARTGSTPAAPQADARPPAGPSGATGAPAAVEAATGNWVDEPHSRLRAIIAARLTESKNTIPHFYLRASIRVDRLLALRRELNDALPVKISVNDLVVKAAAAAYRAMPEMNVIWTDAALRRFTTVDVGIAVASERGLVTPVLRSVDTLSVGTVSERAKELVTRANAGRLRPDDLEGGALTISNLGMYGVEDFAAIINPPQSAILAVGAARPEAVVVDGGVEAATVLRVTLSVDHRAVDGALAAQWLRRFVALLEAPVTLLA